jgi:hypothetical protein
MSTSATGNGKKIAALMVQGVAAGVVVAAALTATGAIAPATATALGVGAGVSIALSKHIVSS